MIRDVKTRCSWCGEDPLYVQYHDEVWGAPVYEDGLLFARLILDGAQAGLSWITILRREASYWEAFDNFDAAKMARYDEAKVAALLGNAGIIRNRLKIRAAIQNAQGYLNILEKEGSFSDFLWQFVGGAPIQNQRRPLAELPAATPESRAMSKALKQRGFSFVGETICYAFMQAVGMVNDHVVDCFRHAECVALAKQKGIVSGEK
ncbi:MAG: DNA-3-methyladenine glycosylase I [Candidatus Promineifilaceae bacterium]